MRSLAGALLLAGGVAGGAGAQGPEVVGVGMRADLTDDAHTEVRLHYRLRLPPGTAAVRLRAIAFFGAELDAVRVRVDGGGPIPVRLERPGPASRIVEVPMPARLRGGGPAEMEVAYRVTRNARLGDAFDIALPVLLVEGTPAGSPEDFFVAEAVIPAGYTIVESFPTVPRTTVVDGTDRRYGLQLQVIPAMVRWRGRVGDAPLITFERIVDALALGTLLLFGALLLRGRGRA